MKKTAIIIGIAFFISGLLISSNASAATWYIAKVINTVSRTDGSVTIQFIPGTGESRFTGTCRAQVQVDSPGANKILATILTAVSMDSDIRLGLDYAPSWDYQDMVGVGILSEE